MRPRTILFSITLLLTSIFTASCGHNVTTKVSYSAVPSKQQTKSGRLTVTGGRVLTFTPTPKIRPVLLYEQEQQGPFGFVDVYTLRVAIVNASSKAITVSPNQFLLIDQKKVKHKPGQGFISYIFNLIHKPHLLRTQSLAAGQEIRADLVFSLPPDRKPVYLSYTATANKQKIIKLDASHPFINKKPAF